MVFIKKIYNDYLKVIIGKNKNTNSGDCYIVKTWIVYRLESNTPKHWQYIALLDRISNDSYFFILFSIFPKFESCLM